MASTKYLYTYAVVRVDSGVRRDIAVGFTSKADAEGLAVLATNNVPGREFVVKQRRTLNPAHSVEQNFMPGVGMPFA
jgi:hypothetical protein